MTIPIYDPARVEQAADMTRLATDMGLDVLLYCNSAVALKAAIDRELNVDSSNENAGYGRAANLSVAGKDFDWLIVCNDDITVDPSEFARFVQELRDRPGTEPWLVGLSDVESTRRYRTPGATWVFTSLSLLQAAYIRAERKLRQSRSRAVLSTTALIELRRGQAFPFTCVAINRPAWLALGGFDPRFDLYFEDMDLLVRAHLNHSHVAVVPARIHHVGSASTREHLSTTLPVLAWSGYQYLVLHTRLGPLSARVLVATAMLLRLLFVPFSSSPARAHIAGIARSVAVLVGNRRPHLPQWQN